MIGLLKYCLQKNHHFDLHKYSNLDTFVYLIVVA